MSIHNQDYVIESYRKTFLEYGVTPEALQWSPEGQRWRFDKLIEIITSKAEFNLNGKRLLEIGCGLGHLYPFLKTSFGEVDYTGIDIVPEFIDNARQLHHDAIFECRDIINAPFAQDFDFVFISGVFNSPFREDSKQFMIELLNSAYQACKISVAFNFTSSYVNFTSPNHNYFDPDWVLLKVLSNLSRKVQMSHHYRNCDVAVCVSR